MSQQKKSPSKKSLDKATAKQEATSTAKSPTNTSAETMPDVVAIAKKLCKPAPYQAMIYESNSLVPMPSLTALDEMVNRLKAAFFPGYFGQTRVHRASLQYHLTANLDSIYRILREQVLRGLYFTCVSSLESCSGYDNKAEDIALAFMDEVPRIRDLLSSDVSAAYEGDPAAKSPGETIFCYPSLHAMTNHRIAHTLYKLNVPLIPRIISEMAHSATGIDINPGAQIGEEFFIDHGTGVVIGETCIIGSRCRLYQGVTLGAVSFARDEDGGLVKGLLRHPILEDDVIVYAGATILGRVTIGAKSVIGGNVWLTKSVPPESLILQKVAEPEAAVRKKHG